MSIAHSGLLIVSKGISTERYADYAPSTREAAISGGCIRPRSQSRSFDAFRILQRRRLRSVVVLDGHRPARRVAAAGEGESVQTGSGVEHVGLSFAFSEFEVPDRRRCAEIGRRGAWAAADDQKQTRPAEGDPVAD